MVDREAQDDDDQRWHEAVDITSPAAVCGAGVQMTQDTCAMRCPGQCKFYRMFPTSVDFAREWRAGYVEALAAAKTQRGE